MQFLPHTQAALDEYLSTADPDLEQSLRSMGRAAERIVPDCVGLSLTLSDEDLTFTLVPGPTLPGDGPLRPASDRPVLTTDAGVPPPRGEEGELLDEDR